MNEYQNEDRRMKNENERKRWNMKFKWKNEIWTGNSIGDEGTRMISEALKTNYTLTTLHLGGDNDYGMNMNMKYEWWNEIWTANNIGDEGARMISEALKTNHALTTLGLSCNNKEVNE